MATETIKNEFLAALKQLGIDKSPVIDENGEVIPDVELSTMLEDNFWLPKLALKANEISQFLLKGTCFDVTFKLDSESVCGFVIDKPDPVIKSEYGYPMFEAQIADGLRTKIIEYTVSQTLGISNDGVALVNKPAMYDYQDGDKYIRPLDPEKGLLISLWHDRSNDISKALELALSTNIDLGMKP
mgnify:CR=1 FL=1